MEEIVDENYRICATELLKAHKLVTRLLEDEVMGEWDKGARGWGTYEWRRGSFEFPSPTQQDTKASFAGVIKPGGSRPQCTKEV